MYGDIQQTFYILIAPFLYTLFLPAFLAGGIITALLIAIFSRFWRRPST